MPLSLSPFCKHVATCVFREYQGLAYKSTRLGRPFVPYVNGIIGHTYAHTHRHMHTCTLKRTALISMLVVLGDAGVALAMHARYCVVGPKAVLGLSQVCT